MRWTTLALLASLLAGCASDGDGNEEAAEQPNVVTDPRDLAASMQPGSHVHDYWDGRDQVQVVAADSGGGSVSYGGDHGIVATFVPPDGSIVPQGTGVVEATLDWTEDEGGPLGQAFPTAFTRVELWVKTAADAEPHFVQVVEKGVPFRFNATNEQDDPPHYVVSLWEFSVMLWNEGGERTTFNGQWRFSATAHRTLPLATFPPHPDPWAGQTEKLLYEHAGHAEQTGLVLTSACTNGCLPWFTPDSGTTVPFDAARVEVVFAPGAGATPVPVSLAVHGADSRSFRDVAGQDAGNGATRFTIELEPGMGDSPYAAQSLWEFRVHPATPQEQGVWRGAYTVSAKALR